MKKSKAGKIAETLVFPLLAVAALLIVWQVAAHFIGSSVLMPSVQQTAKEFLRYILRADFWASLCHTIFISLIAFISSVILAAITASLALICRPLKLFLRTTVSILRSVPTISVILLLIVWVNSQIAPIIIALLVIFPTLYASIIGGLETIPTELEETSKIYAVPLPYKIVKIYAPLAAPVFLTSSASAISLNLKLIIAAEVMAQTAGGIGILMQQSQIYFETGRLLALTVAVIIASSILELLVLLIKKLTCSTWC